MNPAPSPVPAPGDTALGLGLHSLRLGRLQRASSSLLSPSCLHLRETSVADRSEPVVPTPCPRHFCLGVQAGVGQLAVLPADEHCCAPAQRRFPERQFISASPNEAPTPPPCGPHWESEHLSSSMSFLGGVCGACHGTPGSPASLPCQLLSRNRANPAVRLEVSQGLTGGAGHRAGLRGHGT